MTRLALAGAAALAIALGGCCLSNPRAAGAPTPLLGPVRVLVLPGGIERLRSEATERSQDAGIGRSIQELVVLAHDAAASAAPAERLRALVEETNRGGFERVRRGPYLSQVFAFSADDLVLYPPEAPGGARGRESEGYRTLVGALAAAERPEARSVPSFRVKQYVYYSDRDSGANAEAADGKARKGMAQASPGWALDQIEYDRALTLVPSGAAGAGVRIAHLDTGYTDHCELFDDQGKTPLDLPAALNVYDGTSAKDPVTKTDGVFHNEGHGTKTSSVIVSPPRSKCLHQGSSEVRGVAPGASLVPIRVTDGILLAAPDAAAKLLGLEKVFDARLLGVSAGVAAGSGLAADKAQESDVLSISLGGQCRDNDTETNELRARIRAAEDRGRIVVVAAGQYPFHSSLLQFGKKSVCLPGAYSGAVAIAGSTILAQPWDLSGRGPTVAVTAPSEWVYRAEKARAGAGDAWGVGDGTSFGTAMTAGLAALWLQRHGGAAAVRTTLGSGVASAFMMALGGATRSPAEVCNGLPPDAPYKSACISAAWPGGDWGTGIVDAYELLLDPNLPKPDGVCAWIKERRNAEYARLCPGGKLKMVN